LAVAPGITAGASHGMSLDWTQGALHKGLRCFHSGAFFEVHEPLGVRVARGARAGRYVCARVDLGRCCFPSFSARQLLRSHFAAAISVGPDRQISSSRYRHCRQPALHGHPPMARSPRNDPAGFPAACPPAPTGGKRVTFMTLRFSVHVRLWWACESDAFEVRREGSLR
jgi:hypothetical protein